MSKVKKKDPNKNKRQQKQLLLFAALCCSVYANVSAYALVFVARITRSWCLEYIAREGTPRDRKMMRMRQKQQYNSNGKCNSKTRVYNVHGTNDEDQNDSSDRNRMNPEGNTICSCHRLIYLPTLVLILHILEILWCLCVSFIFFIEIFKCKCVCV